MPHRTESQTQPQRAAIECRSPRPSHPQPECPNCDDTGVQEVAGMAGGTEVYVCICAAAARLSAEEKAEIEADNSARIMRQIV
jgi:hypothetical protein